MSCSSLQGVKDAPANSFYLRPLKEPKGNIWYHKISAGRERLGNVVAQVVKSVSFETVIIHCEVLKQFELR